MKSTIFFKNTTPELILAFLFSASIYTVFSIPYSIMGRFFTYEIEYTYTKILKIVVNGIIIDQ